MNRMKFRNAAQSVTSCISKMKKFNCMCFDYENKSREKEFRPAILAPKMRERKHATFTSKLCVLVPIIERKDFR